PLVPAFAHALHGGQDFDKFAHLSRHKVPAFSNVAIKRERFILRENVDLAQVGIHAVGKGDVNNAVNAAEGDGGLGTIASKGIKPFSGPSGEQNSERIFHS